MVENEYKLKHEEADLRFLKEWLPKISKVNRAYIKGASRALLYAQDNQVPISDFVHHHSKEES